MQPCERLQKNKVANLESCLAPDPDTDVTEEQYTLKHLIRISGFQSCIPEVALSLILLPQGPQQEIIPHLAGLLDRLLRYIHRPVSRYAPLDVPCRRTQVRRNLVELFLTVTLKAGYRLL